jgi:hypothetical protein
VSNYLVRHLGMKMMWYLQSHFVWLRLSYSSIAKLPFVCVVAHDWNSPRWTTALKVKLLLPPRQSRRISLVIRDARTRLRDLLAQQAVVIAHVARKLA